MGAEQLQRTDLALRPGRSHLNFYNQEIRRLPGIKYKSDLRVKARSSRSKEMKRGEASCEEERDAKSNDQVDVRQRTSVLILTVPQQVDG